MAGRARERVQLEESTKRVRAYFAGEVVGDTTRPRLVWENPHYPVYYFPEADVRLELLKPIKRTRPGPGLGTGRYFNVKVGARLAKEAACQYPDSPVRSVRNLIRLDWNSMDAWFEEDEQVFIHPRNPYTRVDVLASSRHVEARVGDAVVADSQQPRLLFETGVPTRYYLPLVDVRMEFLRPSPTTSQCPYKGIANYWSLEIAGRRVEDAIWTYRTPLPESIKIAGLVSFMPAVDLYVDGVPLAPR